ncbi:synaptic vesicle glycoprotein 2A-like [Nymphalis io]|uniref:synaptic vesicle glycoprotein 2A-like n=1 Tax=Inachis io TaxID=171585 RepID=UPI002167D0DE|nr:synaptic vesicle glycoprotein 2A-like [Nymphalis io]XP_050359037.1 synaptic vesicle glycoprotein 2A-like [Nymphalis io]XP_050359038.1 synaptic vesicle glycoprotein 2A-like [Nymphalis io]XP_050359039.1 synaptic vesicle glycoprotein 2A-like [Nymphalis io]
MEEQACLVRARSDSETSSKLGSFGSISRTMTYTETRLSGTEGAGEPANTTNMTNMPPENPEGNESGELLDYNDSSVLEQFHEDALRQAGCGLSQARVYLAVCLAVAGASLELASIAFILPSAEIELCILPHEKNWLVLISIMGWSLGAVGWGALAERGGRRRALHSALAVNAVFAAIAAFMPTYGTFMMARFCSAIGSGGILSAGCTYAGEVAARGVRTALLGSLAGGMAGGVLLSAGLASAVLPASGERALADSRDHFSAWHRYLLLCTIPILASLISLIWTPESPRYLLDVGREVDAMVVYQSLHVGNQSRVCGAAREAEYRLGELALPAKRRPPALHHVRHSLKMFWQAFFQIFSSTYRSTTLSLAGMLLFAVAIQFYLSSYIPATVMKIETEAYEASKQTIQNVTYEGVYYNETLENIDFIDVSFRNCTFRDILMSHVEFVNCSFVNTALSNIKTSYTAFKGAVFVNSTIIDTDMEVGRELDAECVLNASTVRGMTGACARRADLRWAQRGRLAERTYAAHAALLAAPLLALRRLHRPPAHVIVCGACILLSPSLYVAHSETALYIVEAVYGLLIMIIFFSVAVKILDTYPANLRCTAHGLILSITYMAGAAVRGMGEFGPFVSCVLCALFALTATAFATRIR